MTAPRTNMPNPPRADVAGNLSMVLLSRSPETARLFRARFPVNGKTPPQRVLEGGVEQARVIAERERPDVMVVEGARHDASELLALEPIVVREPGMSVIFLSS